MQFTMLLFAIHVTRRVAQVAARDFKSRASLLIRLSRDASLECCVTITQTMAANSKPPRQASACDLNVNSNVQCCEDIAML